MLRVYNTLSRQKEDFVPIEEGKVKMYVCGPTVYDLGHLGHGRSMLAFDLIYRYLRYFKKYEVDYVSNYTDIDDKMINRAAEDGITVKELAERISPLYDRDFDALGILRPNSRPNATDYVVEMMIMVRKLLADGLAYEIEDGVYFDVTKFADYGKLSKQKLEELQAGARVETVKDKRNHQDFVIWKHKKAGEPSWLDPEGVLKEGRPGWHIECSAMTWKLLGETFDIHGGGQDLTFPHHECEIAQSEGCFGKQFVKYWLHNGYVQIDGEKMSKSLGNFTTLAAIFEQYEPIVVRYALLSTHYRSPIDFTPDLLSQAGSSLTRLQAFVFRLRLKQDGNPYDVADLLETLQRGFEEAMDNDFDISAALARIFEFVTEVNKLLDQGQIDGAGCDRICEVMQKLDQVLGVIFAVGSEEIPSEVSDLKQQRDVARANRDFALADKLRDQIAELGYSVEDDGAGSVLKKNLV